MRAVKKKTIKTMEIEQPGGMGGARPEPQFVSDVIADLLGALGYDYVTLNPGSSFRGLHDSIVNYHRNQTPKVLLCSHEEIGVAFAHGYAKTAQRPGLAICHNLVGLMHASMAVYDAWCDRTPLLILGGAGPADPHWRRWIDFTHSANTQGELVRAFVKWEDEPATPAAAISSIIRGHRIAITPPCGPVYIALDKILQESALGDPLPIPDVKLPRYAAPAPICADTQAVAKAAETLLGARMPVIVAGSLSYDPRATPILVALVEAIGGAYIDHMNHVSFPTAHPQNLNGDPQILKEADVVLAVDVLDVPDLVGVYGDEEGRRPTKAPEVAVIDLSLNDFAFRSWSHVGGDISPADIRLLADPLAGMGQLLEAVKARAQDRAIAARINSRLAQIETRHRALRARQQEEAAVRAKEPSVSRPRLVDMVWEAVRDRDCVLSGRSIKGWPEGVWDFKGVGDYLGANIGGGIGYGPGAAVGAALATHEQGKFPVVILGDGDMVMAAGALWTAVHYKIPMLAIIDNNRSFMNDEEHQRKMARHRERPLENAWIGTAMFDPEVDFATVSRGFGAWAKGPIESAKELAPALREAIAEVEKGGVAVIDVRTVRPW
ncbi:MAG TPA: thiamine pyrophosphate-dependent enzyme [Candidatus Binataceae bacterium]|nr:thiamine pyrophosphate-dependent enzyme [Candidatus Binataceae bacterium]